MARYDPLDPETIVDTMGGKDYYLDNFKTPEEAYQELIDSIYDYVEAHNIKERDIPYDGLKKYFVRLFTNYEQTNKNITYDEFLRLSEMRDIKKIIRKEIENLLSELTTTADIAGYALPLFTDIDFKDPDFHAKCIKKVKGKVKDPEAYCKALKSEFVGEF